MKKYKYMIMGLIGLGLLCSCELTLEPEDTISPNNYFKKAADLELWCNGYYTQLAAANDAAGSNADDMIDNSLGDLMMGQHTKVIEKSSNFVSEIRKQVWQI